MCLCMYECDSVWMRGVCVCVGVRVCVCVRERERERKTVRLWQKEI